MNQSDPGAKRAEVIRWVLGIIGFLCCGVWGVCFFSWGLEEVMNAVGIAILGRIGLILVILWAALPTLQPLLKYATAFMLGSIVLTLIVLAARPKIVPIVIGILTVASTVNWLLRVLSGKKRPPRGRKD